MVKKVMLITLFTISVYQLSAQLFVGKGDLMVGIKVTKEGRHLPIDSLCSGFAPVTKVPINFVAPQGSSVGFNYDSLRTGNIGLVINNGPSKYLLEKSKESGFLSRSSSPGSVNSYLFIDKLNNDTLTIEWTVGYNKLELIDLYPAEAFTDYFSFSAANLFDEYPDTSRYDWKSVEYVTELDQRGLPISPVFPYDANGLYFVVGKITEDAMIELKGYHKKPQKIDKENPYKLFLYEDLAPRNYEFIVRPFADAPESLWLKYPFTIKQPWWKTNRAFLIYGAISPILVFSVVVLIILGFKNRREKELKLKRKLTEAELKAIRAQLNPHFLFNSLSSIQNLVAQHKNELANNYITKLSRLLRQVLSSSEQQFQELTDELKLTQLYLGFPHANVTF